MYLADTNVISETRKARPHGAVRSWFDSLPPRDILIAAVTIGELQAGAESTRRQDVVKAEQIVLWIDQIVMAFTVIPADAEVFRAWARLKHGLTRDLLEDALIAATAQVHGLTVATRNVRDFARFGVPTITPFAA